MSTTTTAPLKKTIPLKIEYLENDRDGTVYKIEALHVTTTKNRRRYGKEELQQAARSLSFRPLNINHNDDAMLPYPENQTLETDFDSVKNAVSGRMRIADKTVNKLIESGRINRLSVEQLPVKGETCDDMACEQHGVVFVGLALLTSDTTPGDGSTRIMTESVIGELLQEFNPNHDAENGQFTAGGDDSGPSLQFTKGMTDDDVASANSLTYGDKTINKGDTVTINTKNGETQQLKVTGFATDYETGLPAVVGNPVTGAYPALKPDNSNAASMKLDPTYWYSSTDVKGGATFKDVKKINGESARVRFEDVVAIERPVSTVSGTTTTTVMTGNATATTATGNDLSFTVSTVSEGVKKECACKAESERMRLEQFILDELAKRG